MRTGSRTVALLALLALTACGPDGAGEERTGTATEALAPPGSDAHFLGTTGLPSSLFPGERRIVQVRMQNTGAASPTNDWTLSGPVYDLLAPPPYRFGWIYAYPASTVAVGSSNTFTIRITAPNASDTFSARMYVNGLGTFGDLISIPINVDSSVTPQWGCTSLPGSSTVPTALAPGEARGVVVAVQNTGSSPWPASGFFLYNEDSPVGFWGNPKTLLTSAVAPGSTTSFWLNIKAPTTPGTYSFQQEMYDNTGLGSFRNTNHCVSTSIVVGGSPPLDAAVVSQNFPTTMAPSESRNVTVTMRNAGTSSWLSDQTYMLYSLNSSVNLWGRVLSYVPADTGSGGSVSLGLTITAPAAPGAYHHRWQMRKVGGTDAAFFGQMIDVPVTVDANVTPQYGATLVSQSIPSPMLPGQSYPASITMRNSGSVTWSANDVWLSSNIVNLWGVNLSQLGSSETVAPGASRTFAFNLKAPATPGTYSSSWRMRSGQLGGFGDTATQPVVVTTSSSCATGQPLAGTYLLRLHSQYTTIDCQCRTELECRNPNPACRFTSGTEDGDATLVIQPVQTSDGLMFMGSLNAPSINLDGWIGAHSEQYGSTLNTPLGTQVNGFLLTGPDGAFASAWDPSWQGRRVKLQMDVFGIQTPVNYTSDDVSIEIDTASHTVTSFSRSSDWRGLRGDEGLTSQTGLGPLVCSAGG